MKKIVVFIAFIMMIAPVMSYAQKTTITSVNTHKTYQQTQRNIQIWYQGEYNLGFATGNKVEMIGMTNKTNFMRPFLETVQGVRITQYAFAGVGLGFQYAFGRLSPEDGEGSDNWNTLLMPVYLNLKGYIPVTEDLSPFLSLSFGVPAVLANGLIEDEGRLAGRYYGEYGVGVKYKKYHCSLGFQNVNMELVSSDADDIEFGLKVKNSFFIKVGMVF
ncbi:MAG: hypothetical protein IJ940_08250 [Bacteroidales bacterium]|nr:hypothetical protein [Bacteroidales bacterium]